MSKDYQTQTAREATVSPDEVVIAMCEIAGAVEEGLLALAVATGMQVMTTMMEADVTAICGPKGRHNPEHGTSSFCRTLNIRASRRNE